jgi:hypothetical protein
MEDPPMEDPIAEDGEAAAGASAGIVWTDAGGSGSSRDPHAVHSSAADAKAIANQRITHYPTIAAGVRLLC